MNTNVDFETQYDTQKKVPKLDLKFKKIYRVIEKIDKKNAKNNGYNDFGIETMNEVRLKNGEVYQHEINNSTKKVFSKILLLLKF